MMAFAALSETVLRLPDIGTGTVPGVLLGVGLWLCVLYGLLSRSGREKWFCPGVLALLLVLILACRGQLLEGFRVLWNRAGLSVVQKTGQVLPEWVLQMDSGGSASCAALFAAALAAVLALVCYLLTAHAPVVLALLPPVVLFAGKFLLRDYGPGSLTLPVLGASVLILLYSGRKEESALPAVLGWALCALPALLLAIVCSVAGLEQGTLTMARSVREDLHHSIYETDYTTLPEGDFTDYEAAAQKPQPALAVTMEQPAVLYLRGFAGEVFSRNRWEPLDSEVLAENRELLYWLNLNAFDPDAQFDTAAALTGAVQSTVSIQNIGACSDYRYVPFCLGKGALLQPEDLNSGVSGQGERETVYAVSGGDVLQVLEYLQNTEDPAALDYRKAESAYRQFVYRNYLQTAEEAETLLADQWDAIAAPYGNADNLTLQEARECTLIFLRRCFPEEGTPAEVELPLEQADGTSFQYATVAAMTLRYYGIPSRYAEGYVITEAMAAAAQPGETITVDSSCARAWVEVYQDGIGWIPMDLAPGMGELIENPDISENNGGSGASDRETSQKPEETPDEEKEEPDPDGGTVVNVILKTALTALALLLVLLVLAVLLLLLRRNLLQRRKQQRYHSEDIRDAAAWIFADTAALLEKLGFDRKNGSMRSLRPAVEEQYGEEFAALYARAVDCNDLALFSSKPLDESHRQTVLCFRDHAVRHLRSEAKWYRRLRFQWILCLY